MYGRVIVSLVLLGLLFLAQCQGVQITPGDGRAVAAAPVGDSGP